MTPEEIEEKINASFVAFRAGNPEEAKTLIKQVLDFDIKNVQALHVLGQICHEEKNLDLARDILKEALKIEPENDNILVTYGNVLNELRQPEEAGETLKKAIELNPFAVKAYLSLSTISLTRGDRDEGIDFIKKALEINPDLVGAYLPLCKAKYVKVGDYYYQEMERLLKACYDDPNALHFLHFALSYVYQQAGKNKEFFHHLKEANKYGQSPDNKWRNRLTLRTKNLKKISTPEFLNEKVGEEYKIMTPVFIVGMPRSGTSLTDQIFATHSQCYGGDELQYFPKYLNRICQGATGELGFLSYPKMKIEHFQQVATLYQKRVQLLSPGTQYISDKMPWNFQMVGMISKILPWAKIIHIHRDPLDCGFSCYRSPLAKNIEFSAGMEDYAFYRAQYQELMDFWQQTIPDRFINLCYEELVDNPEKELRRILEYCGLPWEDQLLDFHKTKRQVRTISSDQVNKPLNKSSIGYRQKYEKELQPMIKALKKYGLIEK